MDLTEKLEIAQRLEALRVDVIEAGFAASSPGDFASVRAVAGIVRGCGVTSLSRAVKSDIDSSWEALREACHPRLHIVLPTSPVHMEHKLRMTPTDVLARARESVAYAKTLCRDVEFSAEDAGRSDFDFLVSVYATVVEAGATVVNIPDTVGYLVPGEMFDLVTYLRTNVPGIDRVDISVHCHNDLGMAVANSLAAVEAGATQVECTLNGIGERAGNASLEELALALKTRQDRYDAYTSIETRLLYRACRVLSGIIGVPPAPNKPIIGANAFAHESGIHQHGVMARRETYEIMRPEDIGIPRSQMILGKHSGRHAFEERLSDLGFALTRNEVDVAFTQFKKLADRKKTVTDDDVAALVSDKSLEVRGGYKLERFVINSGSTIPAMATVKISRDGEAWEEASTGDGPINAAFNAVERIVQGGFILADYALRSVTEGEDALGEAIVKLAQNGETVTGRGISTDIIEASIKAYINGINKLFAVGSA